MNLSLRSSHTIAVLASVILYTGAQTSVAEAQNLVLASQITPDNVAQLQASGPDAIGGIGDWWLSNGTLCAVISAVEHESEFSIKGGSLIDLGFCGRADDHFPFTHDLINGSRRRPLNAESVSIETHNDAPSIVVRSLGDGARLTTRYHFSPTHPTQLHVSKRFERGSGDTVNFISPFTFNYHSLEPFIFNSQSPKSSNGFHNEDFATRGVSAIDVAARKADTLITVSPRSAEHGIAYGWQLTRAQRVESNRRIDVPFFVMADNAGMAMMVLSDTLYIGDGQRLGWLQVPQVPLLSLDPEVALELEERWYVGKHGSVASITDQLLPNAMTVRGHISEPQSAIHVQHAHGGPLTHIVPDADGFFRFQAPSGDYTLSAHADAGRRHEQAFNVSDKALTLKPIVLPDAAKLTLPRGHAMRLQFVGINDTPSPDFNSELTDASVAFDDKIERKAANSAIFLADVDSDPKQIKIAPGDYRVYATKGPEFSLEKTTISLQAGQTQTLDIAVPERAIETPNYIASDLHVHSGLSFDNAFAEIERVRTFTAEHGEVMVASEHDLPTNYAPYIERMGVEDKIVSIPAAEVTSTLPTEHTPYTSGHTNFFPLQPKPKEFRNGMINHENRRLRDILHAVKHQHPDAIAQLNHPRFDQRLSGKTLPSNWQEIAGNGHFFDHMGSAAHPFNPHQSLHSHPNNTLIEPHPETGVRDIDVDLIEVVNGAGHNHHTRRRAVRQDWLALLKQGERLVGTANSDSHTALEQVAVPRTMVAVTNDAINEFNQDEFVANLKAGKAYGTTGPMLNVSMLDTPKNVPMGGTFKGLRGTLTVEIARAAWIDVERLEVQINGQTVDTHRLADLPKQTVQQPLEFERDSFVTVEVFGKATEDYQAVYPDISPYAFSNPIYVDADSDGKWTAPGL